MLAYSGLCSRRRLQSNEEQSNPLPDVEIVGAGLQRDGRCGGSEVEAAYHSYGRSIWYTRYQLTVHMISTFPSRSTYLCFDVVASQSVDTSVSHGDTRETLD